MKMHLICAECGEEAPAFHQWPNRDTGYGCCPRCFLRVEEREGRGDAIFLYGYPEIHHSLPLTRE